MSKLDRITKAHDQDVILSRQGDDSASPVSVNIPRSVIWHSPDGFNWGYGGSGPADLALNILNAFIPPGSDNEPPCHCFQGESSFTAQRLHQDFKRDFLVDMPLEGGVITVAEIYAWLVEKGLVFGDDGIYFPHE